MAAFLARQVPTSGRRKTAAKTDSRGWTPSRRPLRYRIQAMSDIYCKLQTQNEAVLVGSLVCRLPPAALAPRLAKYGKR